MTQVRRMVLGGLLAATFCMFSGCESMSTLNPKNVWHNLQPHRLQMLNRGAPAMSSDAYYSVLDDVPRDAEPVSSAASRHDAD